MLFRVKGPQVNYSDSQLAIHKFLFQIVSKFLQENKRKMRINPVSVLQSRIHIKDKSGSARYHNEYRPFIKPLV